MFDVHHFSRQTGVSVSHTGLKTAEAVTLTLNEDEKAPLLRVGLWEIDKSVLQLDELSELAAAAELVLELLDATSGINETLLTSEGRVRISSDITNDDLIFSAVDCFCFATTHSGLRQELVACRDVDECDRI